MLQPDADLNQLIGPEQAYFTGTGRAPRMLPSLGQLIVPEQAYFAQAEPDANPALPYRLSAYVFNILSEPYAGIPVQVLDPVSKKVITTKTTDFEGKVFFDMPGPEGKAYLLRAAPGKGRSASPPQQMKSVAVSTVLPWTDWEWTDSVKFVVGKPGEVPSIPDENGETGDDDDTIFTTKNILIGGAVLVGIYLLYQHFKGNGAE